MIAPVRSRGATRATAFVWLTEKKSTQCTAPTTAAATSGRTSVPARRTREASTALVMEGSRLVAEETAGGLGEGLISLTMRR